jgi:hypothetical protein
MLEKEKLDTGFHRYDEIEIATASEGCLAMTAGTDKGKRTNNGTK